MSGNIFIHKIIFRIVYQRDFLHDAEYRREKNFLKKLLLLILGLLH